jgi:aspartyl-tRNA synthetase
MNAYAQGEGLPGMGYIFWRKVELSNSSKFKAGDPEWEIARDQSINDAMADGTLELGAGLQGFQTRSFYYEAAGPIAKALGPARTEDIRVNLGLKGSDAAFFLAGQPAKFEAVAGKARNVVGRELGLTVEDRFDFCWIVDFPMYERDPETGKLDFSHNPFSMPQGGLAALEALPPLEVLGYQYDIVCNGIELSSGAVRNHKPEIMYKAFGIVGHGRAHVDAHFGGMLSAFRYGAPPHAGIAPGVDRIVMLLAGAENIREVIMFPMNQRAEDLMMGAPSEATEEQLRELGIRLVPRD